MIRFKALKNLVLTAFFLLHLSSAFQFWDSVACVLKDECCQNVQLNDTYIKDALENDVYGQHIVTKAVFNLIKGHIRTENPAKALALAFHGGTGTGKNHVSRLIAESLYAKGMKSKYVHLHIGAMDFRCQDENSLVNCKNELKNLIESSIEDCERSMFIFDEVDKIPESLLDVVKPYLEYYDNIHGVNYRKSIFLFLSNTAGTVIMRKTLEHWNSGKMREDLTLKDVEKIIFKESFNVKGGFRHSYLLTSQLISAFLPFLPLERLHVRKCIVDFLLQKYRISTNEQDNLVKTIAAELVYYPEKEELFSVTGCKRVPEKADSIMVGYESGKYKDEL